MEPSESDFSLEELEGIYRVVRPMASKMLRGGGHGQTLQTTALVNEAFVKLMGKGWRKDAWNDMDHFLGRFCLQMKWVLLDRIKHNDTIRRGGNMTRIGFDDVLGMLGEHPEQLAQLLDLLDVMEQDTSLIEPVRKAAIARFKILVGLGEEAIGKQLGLSRSTVYKEWARCKAWFMQKLEVSL